jgi:ATP-dependent DNA ligase
MRRVPGPPVRHPERLPFPVQAGNILKRFEKLCYWAWEELAVKEAILDGEVVALDSEGRQDFRDLRAGRGNLHYAAFDTLWMDGKDLRPLLLTRRKQFLSKLIPATTTVLSQVFSIEERGRDMFAAVQRLDLEGIVAKRKADPYRPETVWYKIKSRTYTQSEDDGSYSRSDDNCLLVTTFLRLSRKIS